MHNIRTQKWIRITLIVIRTRGGEVRIIIK